MIISNPFLDNCRGLTKAFLTRAQPVEATQWQSIDISEKPEMTPLELLNVSITMPIPSTMNVLQDLTRPNLPWAEDHFQERISGKPLNPPPSHEWWPFNRNKNNEFREDEKFSHTYPERFWPKEAGDDWTPARYGAHRGIRYAYGDLNDVIDLLRRDLHTRQAYLPIWFPEDTGAVSNQRVPCTLGYHFIVRSNTLYCVYYIRSCDYLRHFRDDVYMAARLTQVIGEEIGVLPGDLTMHITSFHVFMGDKPILRRQVEN